MENLVIPLGLAMLAGLATGIGGAIVFFIKDFNKRHLSFFLGFSAGVMLMISFLELLPTAINAAGFGAANLSFFLGVFCIFIIDYFVPHEYKAEKSDAKNKAFARAGLLAAVGIAIHNFPEGLAILVAGLSSIRLGVILALAITIHNIPEGIAVSIPVLYATKDKMKAFKYSALSGLAEPAGALIGGLILLPFLSQILVDYLLAFVAGIMVFISLDELILTRAESVRDKEGDTRHITILGIVIGMMVMTFSLWLLK